MENEDAYEEFNINNINKEDSAKDDPYNAYNAADAIKKRRNTLQVNNAEDKPKKSKFSTEGIAGFIISIVALYMGIVSGVFITAFSEIVNSDSIVIESIGIILLILNLAASIVALCLCNIGAKKAEYRVFCFIGRGISIFSICWLGLILLGISAGTLADGFSSETFGRYL